MDFLSVWLTLVLVSENQDLQKVYKLAFAATCRPQLLTTNNLLVITLLFCFFSSSTKQAVALEKTIYSTLTYISSLFDEDGVPDEWKNLEEFQNIIYRQIEENKCVRKVVIGNQS